MSKSAGSISGMRRRRQTDDGQDVTADQAGKDSPPVLHHAPSPSTEPPGPEQQEWAHRTDPSWVRKLVLYGFPALILSILYGYHPINSFMWSIKDIINKLTGLHPKILSSEDLHRDSTADRPLLAVLGRVYDVSAGKKHYGPGGSYAALAGRDASRSFVSGDFTEGGLSDDVSDLSPKLCVGLQEWADFYKNDRKYVAAGVLAGRFYDKKGHATQALRDFYNCVREGMRLQAEEDKERKKYPTCSSRWSQRDGGEVWCDGDQRVPRQVPEDKAKGSAARCACFELEYAIRHPELELFQDCDPRSYRCVTSPPPGGT